MDSLLPSSESGENKDILKYLLFKYKLRCFVADRYTFKILSDLSTSAYIFDATNNKYVRIKQSAVDLMEYYFHKDKAFSKTTLAQGLNHIEKLKKLLYLNSGEEEANVTINQLKLDLE